MSKKKFEYLSKADDNIEFLLDECNKGEKFEHLKFEQFEELWKKVSEILKANIGTSNENSNNLVKECIILMQCCAKANAITAFKCQSFFNALRYVNEKASDLAHVDDRNIVSKINEMWLSKDDLPKIPGLEVITLRNLLCLALLDKPLAVDLKRLAAFRKHITVEMLETPSLGFRPLLIKLVQRPMVVASESGQKFIGFVASLSNLLLQDIHKSLSLELSSCKSITSSYYGKIYVAAWHDASCVIKPDVEKCIQNLMEEFLKHRRMGLELKKRYSNLLQTIDVWNVEVRKKNNAAFVSMICNCYRPILWKYLQSGYNSQRCNAVDLFFKAFPLQNPDDQESDQELFEMQYNSITSLLKDDCHVARIMAVRETCNILAVYWKFFSATQIQQIMTIITKSDAVDVSSADVRRMVWTGLLSFLEFGPSYEYLKQILPPLKNHVHEINQRVRVAFLRLLIAIRDKKDPEFKFTAVVPMNTLINRLAIEKAVVGCYIVQLLMPTFYSSTMALREWIKRFTYLIKVHPHSYRNFFMFSRKALTLDDSHNIMCNVISYLGGYVRGKLNSSDESSENDSSISNCEHVVPSKKRRSRSSNVSQSQSQSESQNCAFDDPVVVKGLFDIVTVLWVLIDGHLKKPENEIKRRDLLNTYIQFAQPFISYYKNSMLFNSIVTLSGFVPIGLLTANSITLPGYCLKMLKSIKMSENDEESSYNQSMLIALVNWGRASVVLDHIVLWIEAAFAAVNSTTEENSKKVKFQEANQPNPSVAIHILDTLLKIDYMQTAILNKDHKKLLELWKLMGGIREIVFRRLLRDQPYSNSLVSDEFLMKCFSRYARLIPILGYSKKNDVPPTSDGPSTGQPHEIENETETFNTAAELFALVSWTQDDLFPLLQAETCPSIDLLSTCINNVLYVADNIITLRKVDVETFTYIGNLITSALTLAEHNLYFVRAASRIAVAINFYAKTTNDPNDEAGIWSNRVPNMLSHIINAIVSRPHSLEMLEFFKDDLNVVKTNISKILATYEDNFEVYLTTKERVLPMRLLMQKILLALRVVLGREVPLANLTIPVYSSISRLPLPALIILSPVYSKTFWTSMFLLELKENLGRSVKTLLIDILILNLFSKHDVAQHHAAIEMIWKIAKQRINEFKKGRESGIVKSLGVSLSQVAITDENEQDDQEEVLDNDDRHDEVEEEEIELVAMPFTKDVSRRSKSTLPSSLRCSDENMKTGGTTSHSSNNLEPKELEKIFAPDAQLMREEELIDDFIRCGSELLDIIQEVLEQPIEVNKN